MVLSPYPQDINEPVIVTSENPDLTMVIDELLEDISVHAKLNLTKLIADISKASTEIQTEIFDIDQAEIQMKKLQAVSDLANFTPYTFHLDELHKPSTIVKVMAIIIIIIVFIMSIFCCMICCPAMTTSVVKTILTAILALLRCACIASCGCIENLIRRMRQPSNQTIFDQHMSPPPYDNPNGTPDSTQPSGITTYQPDTANVRRRLNFEESTLLSTANATARYTAAPYAHINQMLNDQTATAFETTMFQPLPQEPPKNFKESNIQKTDEKKQNQAKPTAPTTKEPETNQQGWRIERNNNAITLTTKENGLNLYFLPATGRIYSIQGIPTVAQPPPENLILTYQRLRNTLPKYGLEDVRSVHLNRNIYFDENLREYYSFSAPGKLFIYGYNSSL